MVAAARPNLASASLVGLEAARRGTPPGG